MDAGELARLTLQEMAGLKYAYGTQVYDAVLSTNYKYRCGADTATIHAATDIVAATLGDLVDVGENVQEGDY